MPPQDGGVTDPALQVAGAAALSSAQALEGKGKWKKAEAAYKKALEAGPESKEPYEALVKLYETRKRLDGGVAFFTAMLEAHPDRVNGHYALGMLYRMKKEPDKSREHFFEVIKVRDPEFYKRIMEAESGAEPSAIEQEKAPEKAEENSP